jgi:hypothetical protein
MQPIAVFKAICGRKDRKSDFFLPLSADYWDYGLGVS